MVLVGKVNKDIVLLINRHGQPAVGLSRRRRTAVPVQPGSPRRAARTSASSGGSSASTSNVLKHIAQDYIPVIASVGADREGNSLQHQRRRGRRRGRACARRVQDHVPDRRGRLAARPRRPRTRRSPRRPPTRSRRRCATRRGRDAPEARRLPRRDPRRRLVRAHRRRPRAALAAARAVHRRRPGHEDRTGVSSARDRDARGAPAARARVRDRHVRPQPGRSSCAAGARL